MKVNIHFRSPRPLDDEHYAGYIYAGYVVEIPDEWIEQTFPGKHYSVNDPEIIGGEWIRGNNEV